MVGRFVMMVALLVGCSGPADVDAGARDAGEADSGPVVEQDAGADAGGALDAGPELDAGPGDAGAPDAGPDAGPRPPEIVAVSHHCALRSDGEVRCWGANGVGQLGNGDTADSDSAVAPLLSEPADAISCARDHCCALLGASVSCWGANGAGQLGRPAADLGFSTSPVTLTTEAAAVACGELSTCVVASDGSLSCWGVLGQRTDQTVRSIPLEDESAVEAAFLGYGVGCARARSTGRMYCFGSNEYQAAHPTRGGTEAEALAVGDCRAAVFGLAPTSTCCADSTGQLFCWGIGASLPSTDVPSGLGHDWPAVDGVDDVVAVGDSVYVGEGDGCVLRGGAAHCIEGSDLVVRSPARTVAIGIAQSGDDICVATPDGVFCLAGAIPGIL